MNEPDFILKELISYNEKLSGEKFGNTFEKRDIFIILKEEFFIHIDKIKTYQQKRLESNLLNINLDEKIKYELCIKSSMKKCNNLVNKMEKELKNKSFYKNLVKNYNEIFLKCNNLLNKIKEMEKSENNIDNVEENKEKMNIDDFIKKNKKVVVKENKTNKFNENDKKVGLIKEDKTKINIVKKKKNNNELSYEDEILKRWQKYDQEIDDDLCLINNDIIEISKNINQIISNLNEREKKLQEMEEQKNEIEKGVNSTNRSMTVLYKKMEKMNSFLFDIFMIIILYVIIGLCIFVYKKLNKAT